MKSSELRKGTWYNIQYPQESPRWNREWSPTLKELAVGQYIGPDPEKKGWHLVTRYRRRIYWLNDYPMLDNDTGETHYGRVQAWDYTNEQFPCSVSSKAILEKVDSPLNTEDQSNLEAWRKHLQQEEFGKALAEAEREAFEARIEALIGVYDPDGERSMFTSYWGLTFDLDSDICKKVVEYLESDLWNLDSLDSF